MKKMKMDTKKTIVKVVMLIMAVVMILSFVIMPLAQPAYAEEIEGAVTVTEFDTGKLAEAIDKAKDGLDLNLVTMIAVFGGTLNAADYSAICGYPNIEMLELAGCDTENGIIPDNCMQSRNQLTYISLPANTVTIGTRAFSGNRTLQKISIPSTLRHIGDYAFEGCEKVTSFTLPAELESIGTGAFSDCKSLSEFSLPVAVKEIPDYCFSKCTLTEMHFGPQVTKIGNGAFSDCHSLTDIYFYGTTAPTANESAFQNLKVTIHTYEDGDGFDDLSNNFVSVAYDLSEDSEYIPPKSSESETSVNSEQTTENSTDAQTDNSDKTEDETEKISEETSVESEVISEEIPDDDLSDESETAVNANTQPAQTASFSGISVAIIVVLAAALAVTITLLVVKKKK